MSRARRRRRIHPAALVLGLLAAFASFAAPAADLKRVMLLHSFGRDFKPWKEYAQNIRTQLDSQSPWPLDVHDHALVTARSSKDDPEGAFVDYLHALYGRHPPDIIVSIGAPAADFVQRHRQRLFPTAPMVLTAVERRRIRYASLGPNDVVVAVAHNFPAVIETILRVLPDTRTIMVVNGASPNELFWLSEMRREFKPFEDRIRIRWTHEIGFAQILREAATLPENSAIFWHLMNVDAEGVVHEGDSALTKLHAVANAPIFSYADVFFGGEIVGGPMHSVRENSTLTAAVAVRLLNGEKAASVQPEPTGFAPARFDWRQMQRWSIGEGRLPPGSQILFRTPSVWEQYRWWFILIIIAFVIETGLVVGLIYEVRQRRIAEANGRRLFTELSHVNRVATAGELTASIAHEIRQPLTAIVTAGQAARNWLDRNVPNVEEARAALEDVVRQGHRAGDVITNISAMFKKEETPRVALNVNELVEQVLALTRPMIDSNRIALYKDLATGAAPIVLGQAVQLQQVLLNLISNAMEVMSLDGTRDRRLSVRTHASAGKVLVSVTDSGPGIPADIRARIFDPFFTTKRGGMGMGLAICRSIVESHGGRLTAAAGEHAGMTFQVELPLFSGRSA